MGVLADTRLLEVSAYALEQDWAQVADAGGRGAGAVTVEPQHLCLDKGYDKPAVRQHGYELPIRRIGEEKLDALEEKRHPARRRVVERTLGWLSKCRSLLVRYDKKPRNYLGLLQLACGLLWYRLWWRLTAEAVTVVLDSF